MSRIGVHVVHGPRSGFGDFLIRIRDAGQTLAVVKCVDDFGAAFEAKQINPRTLTVGRVNVVRDADGSTHDMQAWEPRDWPTPQQAAGAYFALVRNVWALNPHIDVWETFNEFSAHWAWQADFYIRLMELVEPHGYKLAIYACSTGNPPRPADDGGVAYVAILSACKRAERGDHYLSLHEYGLAGMLRWTQPHLALRYRDLAMYLFDRDALVPIIISEAGQNAGSEFAGTEAFVADCAWYDSELMKDSYVAGAAMWTLGNWGQANFQDALPSLAEYIATHPTPKPKLPPLPPPPPPGREPYPYVRVCHLVPQDTAIDEMAQVVIEARIAKQSILYSANDAFIDHPDLMKRIVIVWNVERWGGREALEAWVMRHYPPLPEIIYRGFA